MEAVVEVMEAAVVEEVVVEEEVVIEAVAAVAVRKRLLVSVYRTRRKHQGYCCESYCTERYTYLRIHYPMT